jgi:hypothetical protein
MCCLQTYHAATAGTALTQCSPPLYVKPCTYGSIDSLPHLGAATGHHQHAPPSCPLPGSTCDEEDNHGKDNNNGEEKDGNDDADNEDDDEKQQDEEQGTVTLLELTLACSMAGAAPTPCMLLLCCLASVPLPC